MIDATEAEKIGLVSKVFPAAELVDKAVALAEHIGNQSPLAVQLCKEAVNTAYESTLQEGLKFEKRHFHATFSTVRTIFTIMSSVFITYSMLIQRCLLLFNFRKIVRRA